MWRTRITITEFLQLLFNKIRITLNSWLFEEKKIQSVEVSFLVPDNNGENSDNPIFMRRWKK
jgi:hypothetical protein